MESQKLKVWKGKFSRAEKLVKTSNVNVDDIDISKLIETKNNCKYLAGYIVAVIRPVVLVLPQISRLKLLKRKLIN